MMQNRTSVSRRRFLKDSSLLAGAALAGARTLSAAEVSLPFENGERELVKYPQKRPLIRLTARPPQLETPMSVFAEGALTPNDAFFVRYHLTISPPPKEELSPAKFKLQVAGAVHNPLTLSIDDLKRNFEPVQIVAVNQCSGNSRGFFQPRVPGGQSGNGMMGNARWTGVPLKAVLQKAGLKEGARQAVFDGLDRSLLPQTPDFVKALAIDHALDGEVLLAWEMNNEPLPWLNGYPLRLVVPGYYGTYWIKHLHHINIVTEEYSGFWMNPAYRIPDNDCACLPPGTKPDRTIPIERFNVRSFITSHQSGAELKKDSAIELKGIAFDGGHGIQTVLVSIDGGRNWTEAELGENLGRYSFREWKLRYTPRIMGPAALKVRAINSIGQSQPDKPLWNPAGYMRNVVETVEVKVV